MSIVCSICGGTGVKCTAVIDPNTRQFLEFTRNALSDGPVQPVRQRCPDRP